jgi:hypothetical protein
MVIATIGLDAAVPAAVTKVLLRRPSREESGPVLVAGGKCTPRTTADWHRGNCLAGFDSRDTVAKLIDSQPGVKGQQASRDERPRVLPANQSNAQISGWLIIPR